MNDIQIAVRLPSEVVRKLDIIAKRMSKKTPGVKVSRAAVVRMMALEGIETIEEEERRKKP